MATFETKIRPMCAARRNHSRNRKEHKKRNKPPVRRERPRGCDGEPRVFLQSPPAGASERRYASTLHRQATSPDIPERCFVLLVKWVDRAVELRWRDWTD